MLYPASIKLSQLSRKQLQLKIARHTNCALCGSSCPGLRPPPHIILSSDEEEQQRGRDSSDDSQYLDTCACGHSFKEHGADVDQLEPSEFTRKARVAFRLDELLQDAGKLLDFDYTDDDINSLRRQMYPFSSSPLSDNPSPGANSAKNTHSTDSSLSDLPLHPPKRQRISRSHSRSRSVSSLSEQEEDEEEDRPLAARMPMNQSAATSSKVPLSPTRSRGRAGKKGPSHGGMKVPAEQPHSIAEGLQLNGNARAMNGVGGIAGPEARVKLEEKIDERQLSRLATGVTVDTGITAPTPVSTRPEKIVYTEMREGVIKVVAVENDRQPKSLIILTGLKTLFQKQLPKMPREYIARLVYDSNSKALAIIKYGYKVVGGICYRPFPQRGFAEIVFFATASVDQVKGYGGMLMNHFKAHIRKTYPTMLHFLTYADNYAVGYFRKQGFSKDITLDRSVWAGYIKDYEGGTIMQCKMLPKVDYLKVQELVGKQREAILQKIKQMSRSHVVHEGIPQEVWERLKSSKEGDGENEPSLDPKDIPGLRETGWSPSMQEDAVRQLARSPQYSAMRRILGELQTHPLAWAFLQPVNGDEVADYYKVIKNPMDFSTMEHKLETSQYPNMESFIADCKLVFQNCRRYNPETSIYAKNATKLEKFMTELCEKMDIEC